MIAPPMPFAPMPRRGDPAAARNLLNLAGDGHARPLAVTLAAYELLGSGDRDSRPQAVGLASQMLQQQPVCGVGEPAADVALAGALTWAVGVSDPHRQVRLAGLPQARGDWEAELWCGMARAWDAVAHQPAQVPVIVEELRAAQRDQEQAWLAGPASRDRALALLSLYHLTESAARAGAGEHAGVLRSLGAARVTGDMLGYGQREQSLLAMNIAAAVSFASGLDAWPPTAGSR